MTKIRCHGISKGTPISTEIRTVEKEVALEMCFAQAEMEE